MLTLKIGFALTWQAAGPKAIGFVYLNSLEAHSSSQLSRFAETPRNSIPIQATFCDRGNSDGIRGSRLYFALFTLPMIFPTGRDSCGSAPFFVVALLLCGALGGFATLLSSVHRVVQNSMPAWSPGTWVGAGVGVALGLLLRLTVMTGANLLAYFVGWLPGLFVLLSAAGFLGGFGGHFAWSLLNPEKTLKEKGAD